MIKLSEQNGKLSFTIDGIEDYFTYNFQIIGNEARIYVGSRVISGLFSTFTDSLDVPFASIEALETLLSTYALNGVNGPTESGQLDILAELQLKANLTDIQPVSISSIALPTGAATEATLLSIDNKTVSNYISAPNTTDVLLGSNATFTGAWEDVSEFTTIAVGILGSLASASGTLYIDLSQDGGTTFNGLPFNVSDPSFDLPHIVNIVEKYYRIRYVNGAIAQTGTFRLQTKISNGQQLGLNHKMGDTINGKFEGQIVKAVVTGADPDGDYVNKNTSGVSLSNNSTAVLGAAGLFTGGWESVIGYASITVNVDSDLVGTVLAEFSQNGVNVSQIASRTFVNVNGGQSYVIIPVAKFIRIKYLNPTGTQSFFRLQTIFKSEAIGPIFLPVNSPLLPISLAQTVVSVPNDGVKTTYRACFTGLVPVTNVGDIVTITGSATKTIRVIRIELSGTRSAAGSSNIIILRRSTANSGGVTVSINIAKNDTLNLTPTAVVTGYTTPTLTPGTFAGNICSRPLNMPTTTTDTDGGYIDEQFGGLGQAIVLRGVAEQLSINMPTLIAGGTFYGMIEWQEE